MYKQSLFKKYILSLVGIFSGFFAFCANAKLEYNLPEPVSPATSSIFDIHVLTSWVSLWIMVVVILLVGFILFSYRKSSGAVADTNFNKTKFGVWGWLLVPIIVLGIDILIAGPGMKTLHLLEKQEEPDLTIKITGYQWKWGYKYMDHDYSFMSNLSNEDPESENYLREVDNPVVLPVGKRIRLLHTAADVLHAWWVPALAYKKDSIPGYINETWTVIEKEGTYYGQCAEICGTRHAYMPIVVKAVSPEAFEKWIAGKKAEQYAENKVANSDKTWSKTELMAKGEEAYNENCSACHMEDGTGMEGAFPALKASKVATGDVNAHIDIVLNGKDGTTMAGWKDMLNDLDLAAIITYERNAWGNDTGDIVQPSQVKSARGE